MMRRRLLLLIPFLLLLVLGGCIRRMATVTTDPPGADLYVNGVYRGKTPVEVPYDWNWFYDYRLEKKGYEALCVRERFYAPGKHVVPLDFGAQVAPVKSREAQWRHYVLKPERPL